MLGESEYSPGAGDGESLFATFEPFLGHWPDE